MSGSVHQGPGLRVYTENRFAETPKGRSSLVKRKNEKRIRESIRRVSNRDLLKTSIQYYSRLGTKPRSLTPSLGDQPLPVTLRLQVLISNFLRSSHLCIYDMESQRFLGGVMWAYHLRKMSQPVPSSQRLFYKTSLKAPPTTGVYACGPSVCPPDTGPRLRAPGRSSKRANVARLARQREWQWRPQN